ncbi:MAG: M23 family metallopeptidase [Patescibacteria group bacterium]
MNKNIIFPAILRFVRNFFLEFQEFLVFFYSYLQKKVLSVSYFFENNKNSLVKLFTIKRGRYNRPFMHLSAIMVLGIGVLISPFLADTFPVFSSSNSSPKISSPSSKESIVVGENIFQTDISSKPRDKTLTYAVEKGDTLSTIAQKFGISVDTIRWENDLTGDDITVGDSLKILPVTGIEYKVQKGDSVYSIAKKLDSDAQKIVDFPFNDFANPETFALVEGQTLIVPDGVKPSEQPFIRRLVYIAQGPVSISALGFTWPANGVVSQFASWYHMALDIAAPIGTPIVAAQTGVVTSVSIGTWNFGYGTDVWVDNGGGFASHYTHLSAVNVTAGDNVAAGKTVLGWIGMTGRTTGPHVHFEIKRNGVLVNPLPYLQ